MKHIEQHVSVTNENIKKGKVAYTLGAGLAIVGCLIPLAKCATQVTSPEQYMNGFDYMSKQLEPAAIAGGVIIGIGCILAAYGRIKHWYYNRPL